MKSDEIKNLRKSYLTFMLGEDVFASHVSHINSIVKVTKITNVPKSPDYMPGVINLRGIVLPIIDLRIKLGMSKTEYTSNTCILVAEICYEEELIKVGILTDSVKEVIELNEIQIMPPPSFGKRELTGLIQGIASYNNDFFMILNMGMIFNTNRSLGFCQNIEKEYII